MNTLFWTGFFLGAGAGVTLGFIIVFWVLIRALKTNQSENARYQEKNFEMNEKSVCLLAERNEIGREQTRLWREWMMPTMPKAQPVKAGDIVPGGGDGSGQPPNLPSRPSTAGEKLS